MPFKTAVQLRIDADNHAESKTLEEIREEIAEKLQDEANEGGQQVEYFSPLSVRQNFLEMITEELNNLGYKAVLRENSNYKLLTITW
ncbi:hypothetical protein FCH30_15155 [Acinetobacter radioresistens]|uniref:hypothetical protein n=1 Tax=Acinetobacter radioresistens TaxID=40216 RepID=UPI00157AD1EA|nr:hypothetical protein [Acinetobacter radioresistens]NTY98540.1 hypothetical protein [Acinetobacter radioresistens]